MQGWSYSGARMINLSGPHIVPGPTLPHTEHCSGCQPSLAQSWDNEEWQQQPAAWCNIQHLQELRASSRGGKYLMGMLWLIFQITGPDINIRGWGDGHKISPVFNWDVLPIKTNLWHLMFFEDHVLREFNDWTAHNFMGYELWAEMMSFCFPPASNPTISNFLQPALNGNQALNWIHKYLTFLSGITKNYKNLPGISNKTVFKCELWCYKWGIMLLIF